MNKFYEKDETTALEAMNKANWIAFAPVVFQAARALKNTGILRTMEARPGGSVTLDELADATALSPYGVRVLCEAGLAIGLMTVSDNRYALTKTARFFLNDAITVANTDFVNDVCYEGMFSLEASIRSGKPTGLKVFGNWPTVYEGLSQLPQQAQDSWFQFDHHYSDISYPKALPVVFAGKPKRIIDLGGNTGKFAFQALQYNQDVHIAIMDLPGQLTMAKKNAAEKGLAGRMSFIEANVLNQSQPIPQGYDTIWMSQFLDCFSEEEIVTILRRCAAAMDSRSRVFIMELFWDRQRFNTSAFCLMMTSLYFTNIANGNSQMYKSELFISLIEKAGLCVEETYDDIYVHTLLKCKKKA